MTQTPRLLDAPVGQHEEHEAQALAGGWDVVLLGQPDAGVDAVQHSMQPDR
jgi:hypothetical protein